MKKYALSLFIFRRDLRLSDNTALIAAAQESKTILPCFIFDPRQVGNTNQFRSMNAIQFMIESLEDLQKQLKDSGAQLYFFSGEPHTVVKKLLKKLPIDALFVNKDYTPFSINRDRELAKIAHQANIELHAFDDIMLNPPESIMTGNSDPYQVFTPYWKKARLIDVATPHRAPSPNWYTKKIDLQEDPKKLFKKLCPQHNDELLISGGTQRAQQILSRIKKFKNYAQTRDNPALPTTHLSAYLKFGCVSIRYTFWKIADALGDAHPLLRQLYWRDFWIYVAYYSPYVYGKPYHQKYEALWWSTSKTNFERWCTGTTGFPIVDAGMRQLNQIGFMHNRTRMIVASFLTKDLHINWLWGEKYFAQQLVDYDPAINNGNWQWCASTGCDAQPYFRIFNPWLQQKKYDPECTYIKQWVPELKKIKPTIIHNWFKENSPDIKEYPRPMCNHKEEAEKSKKLFKKA